MMTEEVDLRENTKRSYRFFLVAVFLGVIATAVGLSLGYPHTLLPSSDYATFSGIARDGWIEDGATIRLPRLYSRGNRLDLGLKRWRPAGQPPAELSFSLCGEEIARHTVQEDGTIRLYLTGDCEPREVKIRVLNPFTPSVKDTRKLGAQLVDVKISSRVSSPIVHPESVFLISLFVVMFLVLSASLFPLKFQVLATLVLSVISGWLIFSTHIAPITKLFALWSVACLSALGAHLAVRQADADEPSEEIQNFISRMLVLCVLLVAGYFRFVDLSFGLPMNYHPDEVPKVNAIMRMYSTGTLNPQYFLHPTLLLYSTYAMNTVFHTVGFAGGEFQNSLVLAGRTVSALAGLFSVLLVYGIGRELFSRRVGLLASALLAVFPLHVTCSRYLKEDSLLTFFVLCSFLVAVYAVRRKNPSLLVLSGIFAGCSASVKYSGLLSAGIPCLGAMCLEKRWIPRSGRTYLYLLIGLALVPIGFILCSPYVILDSESFIRDFTAEQRHMSKGHFFAITSWSQYWTYHVERSFLDGVTLIPCIVAFLGMGFLAWQRKLSGLMLLALILAFYLPAEYVKAKPAPQPERYILPCLPFAALVIAAFAHWFAVTGKRFLIFAVVLLILPALRTFELHRDVVPDTRAQMAAWMEEYVPEKAKVYVVHKRYSPELSEERFAPTYAPRSNLHRDLDLKLLAENGYQYLLLSSLWYDRYFSQPKTDEAVQRKILKVFKDGKVLKQLQAASGTYGFHNPALTLFVLGETPDPE